jgi:hypothetical protein
MQSLFNCLHFRFIQGDSLQVGLWVYFDDGVNCFPSHTLCPSQHRLLILQLRAIPMLFQNAPTAFYGIVFAVIGWLVEQLNGLANPVGKRHHPLEKLGANAAALWSIIDFELQQFSLLLLPGGQAFPPILYRIDNEITGFERTAKVDVQLPTILIDQTTGNVFLLTPHVMVTRLRIASRLSTA